MKKIQLNCDFDCKNQNFFTDKEKFIKKISNFIVNENLDEDDGTTPKKINDYINIKSNPCKINTKECNSTINSLSINCTTGPDLMYIKRFLMNNGTDKNQNHSKFLPFYPNAPLISRGNIKTRNVPLNHDYCSIDHNTSNHIIISRNHKNQNQTTNVRDIFNTYFNSEIEKGTYLSPNYCHNNGKSNYSTHQFDIREEQRHKNDNKNQDRMKELSLNLDKSPTKSIEKLIDKQLIQGNPFYITYKSLKYSKSYELIKFIYYLLRLQTKDSRSMLEYILKKGIKKKIKNNISYVCSLGTINSRLNLDCLTKFKDIEKSTKENLLKEFEDYEYINSLKIYELNKKMINKNDISSRPYFHKIISNSHIPINSIKKRESNIVPFKNIKITNSRDIIEFTKQEIVQSRLHQIHKNIALH